MPEPAVFDEKCGRPQKDNSNITIAWKSLEDLVAIAAAILTDKAGPQGPMEGPALTLLETGLPRFQEFPKLGSRLKLRNGIQVSRKQSDGNWTTGHQKSGFDRG